VTDANVSTGTSTTVDTGECRVSDGVGVIASLPNKLIYCVHEQRDIQHGLFQDFAIWFEQLVATPDFVSSVDSWT